MDTVRSSATRAALASLRVVLNEALFRIEWDMKHCPLGDTDEYHFFRFLLDHRGNPVSFLEIAEAIWGDSLVKSATIRRLKCRVVGKLRRFGMPALAERIRAHKEHYCLWIA